MSPQTRMFRDRMVSMEQTLEGGEKNLELLKGLCLEALPDFAYREHVLDHERDLFVMQLEAADGRRKSVGWTRMMLFDAERIPAVVSEPGGALRAKIVAFLRERASRPEIVVTFRHLEEGWTDTPEPRPSRRRRRRGRGGQTGARPPERGAPASGRPAGGQRPGQAQRPQPQRSQQPPRPPAVSAGSRSPGAPSAPSGQPGRPGEVRPAGSRRRFRRRRRGRGGGGGGGGGTPAPPRTQ